MQRWTIILDMGGEGETAKSGSEQRVAFTMANGSYFHLFFRPPPCAVFLVKKETLLRQSGPVLIRA